MIRATSRNAPVKKRGRSGPMGLRVVSEERSHRDCEPSRKRQVQTTEA